MTIAVKEVLCKNCKFHDAQASQGRDGAGNPVFVGFCVRYPPQVLAGAGSSFPVVGSDTNWCGEFVPTTKATAEAARAAARPKKGK